VGDLGAAQRADGREDAGAERHRRRTECLQVDGNDLIAVLEAMRRARERALAGHGGMVVEPLTYRLSDHTTADDARRYRDDAEVAAWRNEPLPSAEVPRHRAACGAKKRKPHGRPNARPKVDAEVNAYLATPAQPVQAMFDHLYADPPPELLACARRHRPEAPWMSRCTPGSTRTPPTLYEDTHEAPPPRPSP
jgi:TPP-dependent pyruvate/acetoin dehydrogenase alpha subunit